MSGWGFTFQLNSGHDFSNTDSLRAEIVWRPSLSSSGVRGQVNLQQMGSYRATASATAGGSAQFATVAL